MKHRYETIIWDWNGTLLDDSWLAVRVMDNMLTKRDLPGLTLERYQEVFDFPVQDYYARVGFDFNLESFELLGMEFINHYNNLHFECGLRPFAKETLRKFQDAGLKQYVLSARKHDSLGEEMKYHGISHYFENFMGLSDIYANGKIELGKLLFQTHQINPKKAVLIGDTVHDTETANALGIDCILVEGGHQSAQRLKMENARIFKTLEEIRW
jgi:phosphoglycolate phosphatase